MTDLLPFNVTEGFIGRMKRTRKIPVDFYTRQGQVLISSKENATSEELEKLEQFITRGVYFRKQDQAKLLAQPKKRTTLPSGLSTTRLFSKKVASELLNQAEVIS